MVILAKKKFKEQSFMLLKYGSYTIQNELNIYLKNTYFFKIRFVIFKCISIVCYLGLIRINYPDGNLVIIYLSQMNVTSYVIINRHYALPIFEQLYYFNIVSNHFLRLKKIIQRFALIKTHFSTCEDFFQIFHQYSFIL